MKIAMLAVLGLVLLWRCDSAAQQQPEHDSIKYQLPPVTVTATRVSEPWVEVPAAVTTLTPGEFQNEKGFGTAEILGGIPGVFAQSRSGSQDVRLSIRGFGARGAGSRSNAGTTRGIRLLVDGFPETEPDGRTSLDLVDFHNAGKVDVLRSNASVVWGNAAGGVVNITSNTDFAAPFVRVSAIAGSYGYSSQRVTAGTMLGDGKFFFALTNTTSDGWRYHSSSSQTLLNTGILTPIGETTDLGVYLTASTNMFRIPGPLSQAQFDSLAVQADSLYIRRDERRFNRLGRLGVSLSHEFGERNGFTASVFASPKVLQRSERGTFRDFNRYHVGGNVLYHDRFTLIPGTRDMLIVGIDEAYQDGPNQFYNLTASGDRGTTVRDNKAEGSRNTGLFVSEEVALGERWTFVAGGRYDMIKYFYTDFINPAKNDERTFEKFTPKIGVTYQFGPMHSVYANIGGGVEVPAGNEVNPIAGTQDTVRGLNPLLEPIVSTTYEVGTKHILRFGADGAATFTYDAAVFFIDVRDDIVPYASGSYFLTAGKTQRVGAELGLRLALHNGLSFGGALTLMDNSYETYIVDSVYYGKPGRFADYGGNTMAGVPGYFMQLDGKYAPAMLGGAYLQLRLHNVGKYYADDANKYTVPAYVTLDATVGVDALPLAGDRLSVSAFAGLYNVTDKKYAGSAWINPDLVNGRPVFLEPGLPRNFAGSVSLGWKF